MVMHNQSQHRGTYMIFQGWGDVSQLVPVVVEYINGKKKQCVWHKLDCPLLHYIFNGQRRFLKYYPKTGRYTKKLYYAMLDFIKTKQLCPQFWNIKNIKKL